MIQVEREIAAEPGALIKHFRGGANRGKTEAEAVVAAWERHEGQGKDPASFRFSFKRYKEGEVKKALSGLFHGKCAYCETFYAASQPMDVEHWRPKGEVHLGNGTILKPGYYWLAADWGNLLPSCIDCNRARKQWDVLRQEEILLGKANQFPLLDEATRTLRHHLNGVESPALINPCLDDPESFFAYSEDGVVVPRVERGVARERALASIRVYALNRSDLVAERVEVIRRIDHHLALIRLLADFRETKQGAEGEEDTIHVVEELISIEVDTLQAMTSPRRPFAGLARFFLLDFERP